jgi:TRAP-type C4-dicarboxylate transport system permease small subunit
MSTDPCSLTKVPRTAWRGLLRIQELVSGLTLAFVWLSLLLVVVLRYLFGRSIDGLEMLAAMVGIWTYFVGAGYVTFEHTHVRADLSALLFKSHPHTGNLAKFAADIASFGLCVVASGWTHKYIVWGFRRPVMVPGFNFNTTYLELGVYVGLILMSFYFLIDVVRDAHTLLRRDAGRAAGGTD